MSTKNSQQTRRTPLSLGPTTAKQQSQSTQQQNAKPTTGSNGNSNAHTTTKGNNNQKNEPTIEIKEIKKQTQQQQNASEKKQQSAVAVDNAKKSEKNDDKKSQNGVGKSNGSSKDKQQQQQQQQQPQNGAETNGSNESATKDKKVVEKPTKEEKKEKEAEKKETAAEKKEKDAEKKEKHTDKKEKETDKREKDVEKKLEKVEKETRAKKAEAEKDAAEKKKTEKDASEPTEMDTSSSEVKTVTTPSKAVVTQQKTTPVKPLGKSSPASTPPVAVKFTEKTETHCKLNFALTTPIDDDVEMEPLTVDSSPTKAKETGSFPVATSTPGKPLCVSAAEIRAAALVAASKSKAAPPLSQQSSPDRNNCPRSFAAISGRRSIRPLSEFTPSKFQSNTQFRESYRRINTELDVTSNTNTSLNVTVGSEAPNSSSFSFFGRGRKRERTPPRADRNMELDGEHSPPKRARLEGLHGFFSSFISRFSKTTLDTTNKDIVFDENDVQNVSGISIETDLHDRDEVTTTEDITVGNEAGGDETPKKTTPIKNDIVAGQENNLKANNDAKICNLKSSVSDDVENADDVDTPLMEAIENPTAAKNKKCSIM